MRNEAQIPDSEHLLEGLRALHDDGYQWALRLCGNDEDMAADVLQAVYLKILEGKAVFRGESALKTWFFSVIRFTINEFRRPMRLMVPVIEETVESDEPGQIDIIESGEKHQPWLSLFKRLSEKQQQIIDLVFYHRTTIEEAAGIMDISVGTARTHYERAKANLKTLITRTGKLNELRHG